MSGLVRVESPGAVEMAVPGKDFVLGLASVSLPNALKSSPGFASQRRYWAGVAFFSLGANWRNPPFYLVMR